MTSTTPASCSNKVLRDTTSSDRVLQSSSKPANPELMELLEEDIGASQTCNPSATSSESSQRTHPKRAASEPANTELMKLVEENIGVFELCNPSTPSSEGSRTTRPKRAASIKATKVIKSITKPRKAAASRVLRRNYIRATRNRTATEANADNAEDGSSSENNDDSCDADTKENILQPGSTAAANLGSPRVQANNNATGAEDEEMETEDNETSIAQDNKDVKEEARGGQNNGTPRKSEEKDANLSGKTPKPFVKVNLFSTLKLKYHRLFKAQYLIRSEDLSTYHQTS